MKVPQKVGKYELLRQIGRGSTGMIYESQDPSSGEKVAIKIAIPSKAKKSGDVSQGNKILLREANTAKHLDHPNILKMLSADMDEGVFYIVMELVEGGKTLKRYCLEKNLLPYHVVMDIIYKCAKALDYAHRCGIIHRDIKPGNILLTKDMDVRIADFSIASIMHTEEDAQSLGEFLGSPRYMSPEQIQGDKLTIQSDLFSLGIVMFEMITGQHPFYAKRFSLLVHKIINSQQPLLREYRKDVPVVLERIVHHALAKNVKKRYQQGLNMAADLNLAYECAVPAK
ncbi:MAG: serine/threonine protein kinase, partial [Candidatus Eutrophobiaceae bacterium]